MKIHFFSDKTVFLIILLEFKGHLKVIWFLKQNQDSTKLAELCTYVHILVFASKDLKNCLINTISFIKYLFTFTLTVLRNWLLKGVLSLRKSRVALKLYNIFRGPWRYCCTLCSALVFKRVSWSACIMSMIMSFLWDHGCGSSETHADAAGDISTLIAA